MEEIWLKHYVITLPIELADDKFDVKAIEMRKGHYFITYQDRELELFVKKWKSCYLVRIVSGNKIRSTTIVPEFNSYDLYTACKDYSWYAIFSITAVLRYIFAHHLLEEE